MDNVVGIVTRYGLDSPGDWMLVKVWFSAPIQTYPVAHPTSCIRGTWSLSPGGVALTTHPRLAPRLKKEKSYTSTPLWAFTACSKVHFIFTYIYTVPSHRTSVAISNWPLITAIQMKAKYTFWTALMLSLYILQKSIWLCDL
jgi:hypothetical protein